MATKRKARTNDEIYNMLNDYIIRNEARFVRLEKLDERVNGNGKPGLVQDVGILQERETKRDRREWLISGVLVAEAIAFIFTLVT